ncbi:hypothetical protein HKD37_U058112 [Glycine soja]
MFSSLSQTGLRFRDCNHIVEFVFVEFVFATYRLRKLGKERVSERVGIDFGSALWFALRLPGRSSSFSFCLSSSLSQTGLRFRDCNHIVEFVSATYRLRYAFLVLTFSHFRNSKKTRKGKSPGKGGNRFWKSIMVGFKTPREAIEGMSMLSCFETNCLTLYISCLLCCSCDFFVFFSHCQDCFAEFPVSSRFPHPPYFDFKTLVHSSPFSCINYHFHFPSSARLNVSISLMPKPPFSFVSLNDLSVSQQSKILKGLGPQSTYLALRRIGQ